MALCPHCRLWPLRPDDRHCGHCGGRLALLRVLEGSDRVAVTGAPDDVLNIALKIHNEGEVAAVLEFGDPYGPQTLHRWMERETLTLQPHSAGTLHARLALTTSLDSPYEIPLLVNGQVGPADGDAVTVRLFPPSPPKPRAEFRLAGTSSQIRAGERHRGSLVLTNDGGTRVELTARDEKATPQWLDVNGGFPSSLPPHSTISVPGEISAPLAGTKPEALTFAVKGVSEGFTLNFPGKVVAPSWLHMRVRIDGEERDLISEETSDKSHISLDIGSLIPDERRRISFIVRKIEPSSPLILEKAHLLTPPGDPHFQLLARSLVPGLKFTSERISFVVVIDTRGCSAGPLRRFLVLQMREGPSVRVRISGRVTELEMATGGTMAIDFGTANSCVATALPGEAPHTVRDKRTGRGFFPSVLHFPEPDDFVSGDEAVQESGRGHPSDTVTCLKRALSQGEISIHGGGITPDKLASMLLREVIAWARRHANAKHPSLALTVPVDVTEGQRQVLTAAAEHFGLAVDIFDEPTAAAQEYVRSSRMMQKLGEGSHRDLAVFDFGAGTLDVAILRVTNSRIRILARRGDSRLGGVDFDHALARDLAVRVSKLPSTSAFEPSTVTDNWSSFNRRFGHHAHTLSIRDMRAHFHESARRLKEMLSEHEKVTVLVQSSGMPPTPDSLVLSQLFDLKGNPLTEAKGSFDVTRDDYEKLIGVMVNRGVALLRFAIEAAEVSIEEDPPDERQGPLKIEDLLLTGQVSRTPIVRKRVREVFKYDLTVPKPEEFDPKTCVSLGATGLVGMPPDSVVRDKRLPGRIGLLFKGPEKFVTILPEKVERGVWLKSVEEVDVNGKVVSQKVFRHLAPRDNEPLDVERHLRLIGEVQVENPLPRQRLPLELMVDEDEMLHVRLGGQKADLILDQGGSDFR